MKNFDQPSFGKKIRSLRISRGYSQDKFARTIGSNQMTVSSWEVGSRMPALKTIAKIAKVYHIPLSSLICVENTGMEEDYVYEIADMLQNKPKVKTIIDRLQYMKDDDIDVVVTVIEAITKNRNKGIC